jgi:hypothetical protein
MSPRKYKLLLSMNIGLQLDEISYELRAVSSEYDKQEYIVVIYPVTLKS